MEKLRSIKLINYVLNKIVRKKNKSLKEEKKTVEIRN